MPCDHNSHKVINDIKEKLFSTNFLSESRKGKKDFTRKRKLPFVSLVLVILHLGKASMQRELDKFFKVLGGVQEITAGALTHARKKLLPGVFLILNKTLLDSFYKPVPSHTKKVIQRILGVDGSRIDLPDTKEIVNEFGRAIKQTDAKPQGLASVCLI